MISLMLLQAMRRTSLKGVQRWPLSWGYTSGQWLQQYGLLQQQLLWRLTPLMPVYKCESPLLPAWHPAMTRLRQVK